MIPFSDVGGSTTHQELPTGPQKKAQGPHQQAHWGETGCSPLPVWGVGLPPLGLFLLIPSRTKACPSQSVTHRRSWGPQLSWTTSPGVSTSDHDEPSGLGWLTSSLYHT